MRLLPHIFSCCILLILLSTCKNNTQVDIPDEPLEKIYRIPVVVHILHNGEETGTGPNLSKERIERQIEILNEDYRRKEGTPGYNEHPDGADARIEFILANTDPEGLPTNGITRTDISNVENPIENWSMNYLANYQYWNPADYLNIWLYPLDESTTDLVLGLATGPKTDLPGHELFGKGEPEYREGVFVNWIHFGESQLSDVYNMGRTLTHEIGHYLGVLHPWSGGDCNENDFCSDTPAVDKPVTSCNAGTGCNGEPIMTNNFMNWTPDACMNMFTKEQVHRMHYVLENSPYRVSLLNSPGLTSSN